MDPHLIDVPVAERLTWLCAADKVAEDDEWAQSCQETQFAACHACSPGLCQCEAV